MFTSISHYMVKGYGFLVLLYNVSFDVNVKSRMQNVCCYV